MLRRKSNGFTSVELIAMIVVFGIILSIISIVYTTIIEKHGSGSKMTCVEWEDAQVTDCWSYGMGTTCEHRTEKRCVRYDDGSRKTE